MISSSAAFAETTKTLSSSNQAEIWRSLGKEATRTSVPAGLRVGEKVPNTMRVLSFTHRIRERIPAFKSYSYALLQGQVLIIDPRTRKIVTIIAK